MDNKLNKILANLYLTQTYIQCNLKHKVENDIIKNIK